MLGRRKAGSRENISSWQHSDVHLDESRDQELVGRDEQVAEELGVVAEADLELVRVEKVEQ